ncbi:MAG: retention module-containing protein, partial [Gammaproteobacteria bacterium]
MATKNIGFISELSGSAQVRTEAGVIKVVHIGDVIQSGDVLITEINSQVVVTFYGGDKVNFGANTEALLDETVSSQQAAFTDQQVDQLDQVAILQKAIEEGMDLSELEAPAAGNQSQQSGEAVDALHQTSVYEREGREGRVDTRPTPFELTSDSLEQDEFGNTENIAASPLLLNTAYVSLSGDSSVLEGATATYTISIDQIPTADVVLDLAYSGVASGSDYTGVTQVTILAGSSSVNFDVSTLDDVFGEGAEQFTINISNISGGSFDAIQVDRGASSVTTTINDESAGSEDTVLVHLTGDTSVVEGAAASYTLTVDVAPVTDITVNFTYSGTASGADFTGVTSVIIPAGSTTFNFDIATLNDAFSEGAEQFTISIDSVTGGGFEAIAADVADASVTTTIDDAGVIPVVSIVADQTNVTEGGVAGFTVNLDQAAAEL